MEPGNQKGQPEAAARAFVLSVRFREGLRDYAAGHRLRPTEFYLAQLLCLDSFDRGELRGAVDLVRWALALNMRDARGARADKCAPVLCSLKELGIVDVDPARGTFELRPDWTMWSRLQALRSAPTASTSELNLCADRPLSEALSEVSREAALTNGGRSGGATAVHFGRLKEALKQGPEAVEKLLSEFATSWRAEDVPPYQGPSPKFGGGVRQNLPQASSAKGGEAEVVEKMGLCAASPKFGGTSLALAELSSDLKAEAKLKLPASSPVKADEAMRWLESVDRAGRLGRQEVLAQWSELCDREPGYVLRKLRWHFEEYENHWRRPDNPTPVSDPLAWMSRKAREERKLRELRK